MTVIRPEIFWGFTEALNRHKINSLPLPVYATYLLGMSDAAFIRSKHMNG